MEKNVEVARWEWTIRGVELRRQGKNKGKLCNEYF